MLIVTDVQSLRVHIHCLPMAQTSSTAHLALIVVMSVVLGSLSFPPSAIFHYHANYLIPQCCSEEHFSIAIGTLWPRDISMTFPDFCRPDVILDVRVTYLCRNIFAITHFFDLIHCHSNGIITVAASKFTCHSRSEYTLMPQLSSDCLRAIRTTVHFRLNVSVRSELRFTFA